MYVNAKREHEGRQVAGLHRDESNNLSQATSDKKDSIDRFCSALTVSRNEPPDTFCVNPKIPVPRVSVNDGDDDGYCCVEEVMLLFFAGGCCFEWCFW